MGQFCCKHSSVYVRQHDENNSELEVLNALGVGNQGLRPSQRDQLRDGSNNNNSQLTRPPFETRPSEDSTKGSETELDGGFGREHLHYEDEFHATLSKEAPTAKAANERHPLAKRLRRRFRHWRREREDGLDLFRVSSVRKPVNSSKSKDAADKTTSQWLISPDTVCTSGHQGFKEQKKHDSNKRANISMDHREAVECGMDESDLWVDSWQDDAVVDVACGSSSSKNHNNHQHHTIESLPYAVEYSPISGKYAIPAPPSRAGSPRRKEQQPRPVVLTREQQGRRGRLGIRRKQQQKVESQQQLSEGGESLGRSTGEQHAFDIDSETIRKEEFGRLSCPQVFPFDDDDDQRGNSGMSANNNEHVDLPQNQTDAIEGTDREMTSHTEKTTDPPQSTIEEK